MTRFQGLAIGASAATLVPIAAGGVVRATGSGDGCPDWPRCFGKWIPPFEYHALIEYSHRTVAAVSGLILLWLAVVLVRYYRGVPQLLWPGLAAFPLVVVQGWLGKLVVEGGLSPTMVTVHLANAMLLAGVLMVLAANSYFYGRNGDSPSRPPRPEENDGAPVLSRATATLTAGAAAGSLALILTGAYMRALGGALAFTDWPLMGGRLVPALGSASAVAHFTHRVVALALTVLIGWLFVRAWRVKAQSPGFFRLVSVGCAAYVTQAGIGAANVFTRLAPWARALHVVFATLVWGAFVAAATVAYQRSRGHLPLGETGDGPRRDGPPLPVESLLAGGVR